MADYHPPTDHRGKLAVYLDSVSKGRRVGKSHNEGDSQDQDGPQKARAGSTCWVAIGSLLEIVTQPLEVSIISKTQTRKWISMVFM